MEELRRGNRGRLGVVTLGGLHVAGAYPSWVFGVADRLADMLTDAEIRAESIRLEDLTTMVKILSTSYNEKVDMKAMVWNLIQELVDGEERIQREWEDYTASVEFEIDCFTDLFNDQQSQEQVA